MAKKRLYAHIILDASGSMQGATGNAIKAINDYVAGVANDPEISSRVSLTLFNSVGIGHVVDTVKGKEFKPLDNATYRPDHNTPLYDAIGEVVAKIDEQTRREGENVALVILTDGFENASKKHTQNSIAALLKARQDSKNWLVMYLGAEHDAVLQATSIGVNSAHTHTFEKASFAHTSAFMTRGSSDYAKTGLRSSAEATVAETAAMLKPKTEVPNGTAGSNR